MKPNQITIYGDAIERAYQISAKVVAQCGEKYLPIFERLHRERLNFKAKEDMKSLAMQVHMDNK